ncbi:hypothetical protein JGH11_01900 [Dysgonomonas sp. Marseille-P4677]|uniref:hypothetical protein n=1 Tax=Dysgonomonas sp. Marseille-P4677 TaxID=2364790 RepID=UPI001912B4B4|nr:hypothetical protein [Dysgonomonas sp. Marseille-P4677]MBK5719617.1 hypothetical protein [Dysgonomonas sp. Marseille-P4677]
MKRTYITLLVTFLFASLATDSYAQFVVAQDTIRGQIYFSQRPGDFNNSIIVPNDSVFYMFPPDKEIDPWRYVDFYLPSRTTKRGYIQETRLMRVDDYEIVEVERLSSHGSVSFKNDDVRIQITVANISDKDPSIKKHTDGGYVVNGKQAKGVNKWQVPKLRYQSISVTIKGKVIIFPKRVYEHLLNPELENMVVYYNPEKGIIYINANNGGMSAPYNVLWAVSQKGVSSPYIFDISTK